MDLLDTRLQLHARGTRYIFPLRSSPNFFLRLHQMVQVRSSQGIQEDLWCRSSHYPIYAVSAIQVILARYCKVRWNARVTKAIFSGKGITIPAGRSVLGKAVRIDPKTGDTTAKDITIEIVKDNQEVTVKPWTVK